MKLRLFIAMVLIGSVLGVSYFNSTNLEVIALRDAHAVLLSEKTVELQCTAVFRNPNYFSATIEELHLTLMLNNERAGEVDQETSLRVNDTLAVPMSVRMTAEEFAQLMPAGTAQLVANGKAKVSYFMKTKELTIRQTTTATK